MYGAERDPMTLPRSLLSITTTTTGDVFDAGSAEAGVVGTGADEAGWLPPQAPTASAASAAMSTVRRTRALTQRARGRPQAAGARARCAPPSGSRGSPGPRTRARAARPTS